MSEPQPDLGDVTLRPVSEEDLPIIFQHQLDREANRIAGLIPRDRDMFEAHWGRVLSDPDVVARSILLNGHLAGHVVSFERDGRREVGYWMGRRFYGRGIATRALTALLQEVSERPLHARVLAGNGGSRRVLEKCGFVPVEEPVGEPGPRDEILYVLR